MTGFFYERLEPGLYSSLTFYISLDQTQEMLPRGLESCSFRSVLGPGIILASLFVIQGTEL